MSEIEKENLTRSAYQVFLMSAQEIPWPCDATAQRLLEAIYCAGESPMKVTEIMDMKEIASPATIHRKLDDLFDLGLIDHLYKGKNRRTKFVVLTKKSVDQFDKLNQAMLKAREL